jgi:hypothetical protein
VIYRDIYPAIDMVIRGTDSGMKYDFIVRPGGDASSIRLRYVGADSTRLTERGELWVRNVLGAIEEGTPLTYVQDESSLSTIRIPSAYRIDGDVVGFTVGSHDSRQTIVIDPTLAWSTLFGGAGDDYSDYSYWFGEQDIIVDHTGNILITGRTSSRNFPATTGSFQTTAGGPTGDFDAFVIKMTRTGSRIWATYYGGTSSDGSAGIAVDSANGFYLCGGTTSTDFPITSGGFQTTNAGAVDGFLVKFDSNGTRIWGTYCGGTNNDGPGGIATDSAGNAILAGLTNSPGLATAGAFQTSIAGLTDAFVAKFSSSGTRLWMTYFGGTLGENYSCAVATDAHNNILVVGNTGSTDLPVSTGAYQTTLSGGAGADAFIVKFAPTGGRLWATFLGGSTGGEFDGNIAVDLDSNVIVSGWSTSSNFPTTSGAFRTTLAGQYDAYITKFNAAGQLRWSTFCGGTSPGLDQLPGIATDSRRNIVLSGNTVTATFPVTPNAFQTVKNASNDAVVIKFDSSGQELWGTYLGGSGADRGYGVAIDNRAIYVLGCTRSNDFPVTSGAFQTTNGGANDVFIAKFCDISPSISVLGPSVICPGDSTLLRATGGFDAYLWSTGATTSSITVKQAGVYSVAVFDGACSDRSDTVHVDMFATTRPRITHGSTEFCANDSTSLQIPNIYRSQRWSTGATATRIAARQSGLYWVDVVDSNGCKLRSDTVTITVDPLPNPVITASGPLTFCDGDSVMLDAGAGYASYRWSSGATSRTITARQSGIYWVTVTNQAGCSATSPSVTVRKFPKLTASIFPLSPTVFCEGDSTQLLAQPAGMASYLWSTGDTSRTVTLHTGGSVTLTITDTNGCSASATAAISINPPPTPAVTALGPTRFCSGDSVILDGGNGYRSYQWSTGQRTRQILVKDSGSYSLTVTDLVGCTGASAPLHITVDPRPVVAITGPASVCASGTGVYSVAASTGLGYQWKVSGGGGSVVSGAGSPSIKVQWGASGGGSVTVTVTSAAGCTGTSSLAVSIEAGLRPAVTTSRSPVLCPGDSVELDAGDGYIAYVWSTGQTARRITVSQPGSYSVFVHDADGCSGSSNPVTVSINQPPQPAITSSNGLILCQGDSTLLDAGAGYAKYLWSNGYTTRMVLVKSPGTFGVTVTDTNGCTGTSPMVTVNVTRVASPVIAGPVEVCRNSSIDYSTGDVQGGRYQWSVSGGAISGGQSSSSVIVQWGAGPTGSLMLESWNELGCRSAATVQVSIGDRLVPVVQPAGPVGLCAGGSAELDAGAGYVGYLWSTGETTQKINVTGAGSYSVTVRDASGCSGTSKPVDVVLKPELNVAVTPAGPVRLCEGDSVELSASAGYAGYRWSNGARAQRVWVRTGGSYLVTVTDRDSCTATSQMVTVIVNPRPLQPSITGNDDTLSTAPATGYQWLLDGSDIAGASVREWIEGKPGSYQVRITDENGCMATSGPYVVVSQPVAWLDTASARVGDRLQLRMHLAPGLKQSDAVTGYSVRLTIDPKSLFVHGAGNSFAKVTGSQPTVKYQPDGTVVIDYDNGANPISGGELFTLEMEGLATGIPINLVTIRSVVLKGLGKIPVSGNGLVLLSGCDIANGFGFGKRVRIESISPNPAARQITVAYRAPLGSAPHLLFSNSAGVESLRADLPAGTGEIQESKVDVGALASGLYMLELRDREERSIAPVIITK